MDARTHISKLSLTVLILFVVCGSGRAQFSAFLSGTAGYQSNPLYNYERIGDQVRSTYLELAYGTGNFRGRYAGGLTLFDSLSERNFLEHNLLLTLSLTPGQGARAVVVDTTTFEEDEVPVPTDSLGSYGEIFARASGRHDKASFRDYDNAAVSLGGSVRWGHAECFLRLVPEALYRVYPYTKELSNLTGLLTAELTLGRTQGLSAGLRSLVGVKHYTLAAYDSSRFEPVRTFVTVTEPGSGKGGAKITVKKQSGKDVLANADVQTVGHLAGTGFVGFGWGSGSLRAELLYRSNLPSSGRTLVRTPETATINEDIYNDFFSFSGPGACLALRQTLPLSVQVSLTLGYQRKQFGAPAYDLEGVEAAGTRIDRRTEIEIYASRYVSLAPALALDLALSGSVARNESNDAYNDFSGWGLGVSLGFGF